MKFTSILRSVSIVGGVLAAGIAIPSVNAQTGPAREVTRDELRACMTNDTDIGTRRTALDARALQVRDEAAAIRIEQEQLAAEQKRIVEDQGSMDRFTRKLRTHNLRVQGARANADLVGKEHEALNSAVVAHNAQCGRVAFKPEDREAILKEQAGAR